jgi:hypothetical protein
MQKKQIDIKNVAKNLANCIIDYGVVEISHSAALNMTSRALGFKDYNTLKSKDVEINVVYENNKQEKQEEAREFNFLSAKNYMENALKELEEQYPPISRRMAFVQKIGDSSERIEIYIDREYSNDKYIYHTLFCMTDNFSKRVFYAPRFNSLCFFIYPNVKKGLNDYPIKLEFGDNKLINKTRTLEVLQHISGKNWFDNVFLRDYLDICKFSENNISLLKEISDKYSEDELKRLYIDEFGEDEV